MIAGGATTFSTALEGGFSAGAKLAAGASVATAGAELASGCSACTGFGGSVVAAVATTDAGDGDGEGGSGAYSLVDVASAIAELRGSQRYAPDREETACTTNERVCVCV